MSEKRLTLRNIFCSGIVPALCELVFVYAAASFSAENAAPGRASQQLMAEAPNGRVIKWMINQYLKNRWTVATGTVE